ncbi:SCO1431 family membrane protein [Streptomyces sp. NPDC055808]
MTLPATTLDDPRAQAELRARSGGPKDVGPKVLEHLLGWTLVVVIAMLVTQTGLL